MITVIFLGIVLLIPLVGIIVRNDIVYREKVKILELVSHEAKQDIKHGLAWKWRYDEFDRCPYDQMLFKFWRPVRAFYRDSQCWQPSMHCE